MMFLAYSNLLNGVLISFISIVIVFLILYLITLIITPLKRLVPKEANVKPALITQKPFSIADILDESMMVAALIAAIDYREETKTDIRILSIKEISTDETL
jgi:Na+-transporting methylmalonyl-CoA/oxaloacetate decarboxylase gamma subunit